MQQYAKAAKELLDNVAKLTIRQDAGQQPRQQAPILLQTSVTPAQVPSRPTVPIEARISRFKQELLASRINLDELRRLAFQGIPDKDGLRAMTWKLLLGYLPPDPSEWDEVLARKRTEYFLFCEDLIVDPKKKAQQDSPQQQEQQDLQPPSSSSTAAAGGQAVAAEQAVAANTASTILGLPDSSSSSSRPGHLGPAGVADPLSSSDPLQGDPLLAGSSSSGNSGNTGSSGNSGSSHPSSSAAAADVCRVQGSSQGFTGARGSGGSQYQQALQQADPLSTHTQVLQPEMPDDHPLSLNSTSKWHTFFKDNEIMEQIDRDVMRTHPDMHFFSGDSADAEQHRREMKRCLFMYAKLNPGLRYIQGMNELLAPLYYLFRTDPDRTSARYAEADAFYCFVDLISEFRDHFCQQLDNSTSGIKATIGKLITLLEVHDPQLAAHLSKHKVDPQFFAFRWITLLLTQEFPFPDAVRIWDTLLSDQGGRGDCLLRVCLAMLTNIRQQLLEGDFAVIVKTLQRYPSVDVDTILRAAARLPPCSSVLGAPL